MKQYHPFVFALAMALSSGAGVATAKEAVAPRAVIELYTSEGCNSCPPADQVIYELNKELDDRLFLSFHVDYWNYLGWNDPFSDIAYTERQQDYATRKRERYVYTPQVVINGDEVVRATAKAKIEAASSDLPPLETWANMTLKSGDSKMPAHGTVNLAATGLGGNHPPYRIWVVGFDREQSRDVRAGENAGRRLVHANVVREMQDLGNWNGDTRSYDFALAEATDGGVAVLVQEGPGGPIKSASMIRF